MRPYPIDTSSQNVQALARMHRRPLCERHFYAILLALISLPRSVLLSPHSQPSLHHFPSNWNRLSFSHQLRSLSLFQAYLHSCSFFWGTSLHIPANAARCSMLLIHPFASSRPQTLAPKSSPAFAQLQTLCDCMRKLLLHWIRV